MKKSFIAFIGGLVVPLFLSLATHGQPAPADAPSTAPATESSSALTTSPTTEPTSAPTTTATTSPTTLPMDPVSVAKRAKKIAELQDYYTRIYSEPMNDKNRLARLVSIISLSRIDGPPLTQKLFDTLKDGDTLIAQLAWEALHARADTLSPEQRAAWVAAGFDLWKKKAFPGYSAAPLIGLMLEQPVGKDFHPQVDLLTRVALENDPANPKGKACLDVAKKALVTWKNIDLVNGLITSCQTRPLLIPRILYLLQDLPNPPAAGETPIKTRDAMVKFSRALNFKNAAPADLPKYTEGSDIFARPDTIIDPSADRWRTELELSKLNVDAVEIAFCVDATGSMAASNDFVTSYVESVVRLLHLMSDQVHCATIYYRHETNPDFMQDCCRNGLKGKTGFLVKALSFTSDPKNLVQRMRAQKANALAGHGNGAGAYLAGLTTAEKLPWSATSKRIIACTGDAIPTTGTEQAVIAEAKKIGEDHNTLLLFIVKNKKAAEALDAASKAANGGDPILYGDDLTKLSGSPIIEGASLESFKGTSFEVAVVRSLKSALPAEYQDRVQPLVDVSVAILKAEDAAARAIPTPVAPAK